MSETLDICPACAKTLTKHCSNSGCDLVVCTACRKVRRPGKGWQDVWEPDSPPKEPSK